MCLPYRNNFYKYFIHRTTTNRIFDKSDHIKYSKNGRHEIVTRTDKRSNILLFSICPTQTTSRDSIIIGASPNIVTNQPPPLAPLLLRFHPLIPCAFLFPLSLALTLPLESPISLAKHYARRLMRLMQSSDAFNPANLHCALISCASIPLMESLMRNRNILLACCFR